MYTKQDIKEHNKTCYWTIRGRNASSPPNWIMGRAIKVFGFRIATLWKCAKPNYKWNK